MIRSLLLIILVLVLYQAVKIVVRSAIAAARGDEEERRPGRLPGQEMVLDPQCRTYIVKDRAVTRRIGGTMVHFCSASCAEAYERSRRA